MFKRIRKAAFGAVLVFAALGGASVEAKAYGNDYCREYTRTVFIGGRTQEAYGTACLQPDGSWMIVGEGLGRDIPSRADDVNYVIHDGYRDVRPARVVYYDTRPVYYRPRPHPVFVWSYSRGYRGNDYWHGRHRGGRDWDDGGHHHRDHGRDRDRGYDRHGRD